MLARPNVSGSDDLVVMTWGWLAGPVVLMIGFLASLIVLGNFYPRWGKIVSGHLSGESNVIKVTDDTDQLNSAVGAAQITLPGMSECYSADFDRNGVDIFNSMTSNIGTSH